MKRGRWYAVGFSVFYLVFDIVKLPVLTLAKLMQSECLSIHLNFSSKLEFKIKQTVSHTNIIIFRVTDWFHLEKAHNVILMLAEQCVSRPLSFIHTHLTSTSERADLTCHQSV